MYSIGKFAKMIGMSPDTLRNWEKKKKLIPLRTEGNQRRYTIEQYNHIMQIKENKRISIGYCRIFAKHQKDDLERQINLMELFIASRGEDKDRLVPFGFELIEIICKLHSTKIVTINNDDRKTDEQEMIEDIMNIIHIFSCRMNGKKSHINKKIIENLKKQ